MTVRDAAVADIIPPMSQMEGDGDFGNPRLVYNLGHALYEFIEARWGKDGVRQFLFSLRKSAIGGGSSPYEEAFQMSAREFDQQFEKYLKDRFKAFRDKERPADYGQGSFTGSRAITPFTGAISIEPSPSGDLIAMTTGNRRDQELDIILVSSKDGRVVRNLTPGFDMDRGFEYIAHRASATWCRGCRGHRSAIVSHTRASGEAQDAHHPERAHRQDRAPHQGRERRQPRVAQHLARRPQRCSSAGCAAPLATSSSSISQRRHHQPHQRRIRRLRTRSFARRALHRLSGTRQRIAEAVPARSGHQRKTQLTFGTQDEAAAKFLNADTLIFLVDRDRSRDAATPEEARNGNIFNLWSLSLKTGELRQYPTRSAACSRRSCCRRRRVAAPGVRRLLQGQLHAAHLRSEGAAAHRRIGRFGTPGPIVDFQAPLQHTLVAENKTKKGRFDKMFLDGRPPVNVGVTSGGDVFGGSMVSFTDVLGDQQFSMYAAVQQHKTLSFSYLNLSRRFQWALRVTRRRSSSTGNSTALYDPALAPS